jgi:hypothetical protein
MKGAFYVASHALLEQNSVETWSESKVEFAEGDETAGEYRVAGRSANVLGNR